MKLFAVVVVFAALAFLATAQGEQKTCPKELKSAAESVVQVCGPVFQCGKGGKGGHGGPRGGPRESRRRRQEETGDEADDIDEEAKQTPEKAKMAEDCLAALQADAAFADILTKCPEGQEKRLKCIHHEFKKECPDFKPARPEKP